MQGRVGCCRGTRAEPHACTTEYIDIFLKREDKGACSELIYSIRLISTSSSLLLDHLVDPRCVSFILRITRFIVLREPRDGNGRKTSEFVA